MKCFFFEKNMSGKGGKAAASKRGKARKAAKLSPKQAKKAERKAHHDRMKLPKMTLAAKKGLDLEKMKKQLKELKGTQRSMLMARIYFEQKRRKSEKRRERREAELRGETVVRQAPDTIESMREADETIVAADDEEVQEANSVDEFAAYFSGEVQPKLLLSTSKKPSKKLMLLVKELVVVLPECKYLKREDRDMQEICSSAGEKGYTDVLVVTEKRKKPHGVYVCHLPEGPTSFFRLTGVTLAQDIKGGAVLTTHNPELIMKNFDTRLGQRIGRQLQALFPLHAEFNGRRVVIMQNQRDFIFFRQYRYIFADEGSKARLQEIGPRFTLKLRFIQEGIFDIEQGKFEFLWRPDMQTTRKRFFV